MKIYYFTRTGRSRKIAEELAVRQDISPCAITDKRDWNGAIGYLRAALAGMRGKNLPAAYEKPNKGETVAVVFPIWAGGFPPAVRAFAQEVGRENIIAIPTSLGSTLKDRTGFQQVIDLVGKDIAAPVL